MKFVLALFLLWNISQADEMQRLDLIVKDITKLRTEYETCDEQLQATRIKLKDEKERNSILLQEVNESENFSKKEKKYKNVIAKLKRKIDEQNKKIVQLSDSEKTLPALEMQEAYKEKTQEKTKVSDSEIIVFQARAFRLNKDSNIYSGLNGTTIDKWEKNTSFTSDTKTKNMVKITGYFVDKVWQKAQKEMWVKLENATQR